MSKLFLKSARSSAILDNATNVVTIRGKKVDLEPNIVVSPGDVVNLKGETFIAMPLDPLFFGDFSKRTAQIIQPWDAAIILFYCSITPGKKILESGSGSGALSMAILNAIGKSGELTTVEAEKYNIEVAGENVGNSKEHPNWKIVHSRIEEYSTGERYDAIVLDVPEPWVAIGKLSRNLASGGKICCYSPTYNQMEKNVSTLKASGFHVLESLELMKRSIIVRDNATRPDNDIIGHTAFMTFAVKLSARSTKI